MFRPGEIWNDSGGKPIQAHGGGVLYDGGTYYWFGENKDAPNTVGNRVDVLGVSCYSSTDLVHWKNEGIVLPAVPDDPAHDLYPRRVAERPKVIYNAKTQQYVLWLHVDSPDYTYARTGRAVSDSPTGPYRYLGSIAPAGADSRDMTVFQDNDGSAYLFFSSDWNKTMRIAKLTDDYLDTTDTVAEAFVGQSREAPAVWTHEGCYYFIGSGCTGWAANEAQYAVAPSPLGPWEVKGNPCLGPGADITFGAQSTFVLPIADKPGAFIFLADRWNADNLQDSRYVWLPLELDGDQVMIRWRETWDMSVFGGEWASITDVKHGL
jgi:hypothetical protein